MSQAQLYTCHKQVRATPMSRLDYNVLRGWTLPADENGADEGYLVEYLDGGQANHPAYTGYISWSPKAVFERGYSPVPNSFKDRVVAEKTELDARLEKLVKFVPTDAFQALDREAQNLLHAQKAAMIDYSNVLTERIALFTKEPA